MSVLRQDVIERFASLCAPFIVPSSIQHNLDAMEQVCLAARKETFADKGTTGETAQSCLRMFPPRY